MHLPPPASLVKPQSHPTQVMAYATRLLELSPAAPPPEGGGERARRRAIESKRVANDRMRALLSRREGRELAHPSYREGLRAIHEGETRALT